MAGAAHPGAPPGHAGGGGTVVGIAVPGGHRLPDRRDDLHRRRPGHEPLSVALPAWGDLFGWARPFVPAHHNAHHCGGVRARGSRSPRAGLSAPPLPSPPKGRGRGKWSPALVIELMEHHDENLRAARAPAQLDPDEQLILDRGAARCRRGDRAERRRLRRERQPSRRRASMPSTRSASTPSSCPRPTAAARCATSVYLAVVKVDLRRPAPRPASSTPPISTP